MVRPVITCVTAVELDVRGACAVVPMNGVTMYWLIAEPPLLGATHVTRAVPLPGDALGAAGAAGTVAAPAGRIAAGGTSANATTSTSPNFRPRRSIDFPPVPHCYTSTSALRTRRNNGSTRRDIQER